MKKKHFNIPIFIPELACPFRCIYCNQCKISGSQELPDDVAILHTIESYLPTMPKNSEIQLAYFGGNFTGLSLKEQEHYLKLVSPYIQSGQINSIRISTRPDYITEEVLDLLKKYKVDSIELGAQSLDDSVLLESKRGHLAIDTEVASKMIKNYGFSLGLQMMIGLPGDSLEKSIFSANKIVDLGADSTRIYPTLVIKDTVLENMYNNKQYHPLSLTDAILWARELLLIFEQSGVKMLKLGLHPSEGLASGKDLIAGPFHPSFRELVETQIWNDLLKPLTQKNGSRLEITIPENQRNFAVGYEGLNKKMLEKLFKQVKFRTSEKIEGRNFRTEIID